MSKQSFFPFSRRLRLTGSLLLAVALVALFALNITMRDAWSQGGASQLFIVITTILVILGSYWKYSPSWTRLRDKMVSTTTNGEYGSAKSGLRAVVLAVIVVVVFTAGLVGVLAIMQANGKI